MQVYQITDYLNNVSTDVLGPSNISMPSGEVFECLSLNYKFYREGSTVDQICKYNSQIALNFGLTETSLTWIQLADISEQLAEIRGKLEKLLLGNQACLIESKASSK